MRVMTQLDPTPSSIPSAEPNGFVKTLNQMGYMTSTLDPVSQEFVRFAKNQTLPVLDLGAAYGVASRQALMAGARVIANDLDGRHLDLFESTLPEPERSRLSKLPGDLRSLSLPEGSCSAILVCRVLHFFRGEEIEAAAQKFHRWLAKGGRIFVVCETPYLKNFSSFIPVYEERKRSGVRWPGFIANVAEVAPERAAFLPPEMHLLDPEVLTRSFEAAGFLTTWCSTLSRTDFPEDIRLDGRESVGYIGRK